MNERKNPVHGTLWDIKTLRTHASFSQRETPPPLHVDTLVWWPTKRHRHLIYVAAGIIPLHHLSTRWKERELKSKPTNPTQSVIERATDCTINLYIAVSTCSDGVICTLSMNDVARQTLGVFSSLADCCWLYNRSRVDRKGIDTTHRLSF